MASLLEIPWSWTDSCSLSLSKFSTFEIEKDIATFFEDKDNRGYDRSLGVISDTIHGNAAYLGRDEKILKEWLTVHGYMR